MALMSDDLDFSYYHPLDHRIWECWARNRDSPIYGKSLVHFNYLFNYRYQLITPRDLWHVLQCRRGKHEIMGGETIKIGQREHKVVRACIWCHARDENYTSGLEH